MKRILYKIIIGLASIIVLVIVPYFTHTIMPWEKANAIETTLLWGGLARLPENADNIRIETSGGMFTRTFSLEFDLSQEELKEWVKTSQRLRDHFSETQIDGTELYKIYPGEEGAVGGTVRINFSNGTVQIDMSWS